MRVRILPFARKPITINGHLTLDVYVHHVPVDRASRLIFTFEGEHLGMPTNLTPGQSKKFTVSAAKADGSPSPATLSNLTLVSSDPTTVALALDPSVPNGGIATAASSPTTIPDAVAITASATATEPDGVTTETISGMDTVNVVAAPPPPPPPPAPAASLTFNWAA